MESLSSIFPKCFFIIMLIASIYQSTLSNVSLTPQKFFMNLTLKSQNVSGDLIELVNQNPQWLQYKEYPQGNGRSIIVIDYLNYQYNGLIYNLSKEAVSENEKNEFYLQYLTSGSAIPIFRIDVDSTNGNDPFKNLVDIENPFTAIGKDKILNYLNEKLEWTDELKEQFLTRSKSPMFFYFKSKKNVPELEDFNAILNENGKGVQPEIDESIPYPVETVRDKFRDFVIAMTTEIQNFIQNKVKENLMNMKKTNQSSSMDITNEEQSLLNNLKQSTSNKSQGETEFGSSLNDSIQAMDVALKTDNKLKEFSLRFNREFQTEIRNIMVGKQINFQGFASRLRYRSQWIFEDGKYDSFCQYFSQAVDGIKENESYYEVLLHSLGKLAFNNFYPFLEQDENSNPWYALTKPLIGRIFEAVRSVIQETKDKDSELKGIQEGLNMLQQNYNFKIASLPPALLVNETELNRLLDIFVNDLITSEENGLFKKSKEEIVRTLSSFGLKESGSSEDFKVVENPINQFWDLVILNNRLLMI